MRVGYPEWAKKFKLPADAANLVKEIHVNIPWPCIANGTALKLLTEFMGDVKMLPLAQKLFITLSKHPLKDACTPESAIISGTELAQFFLSMTETPLATAEIKCVNGTYFMDRFVERAFGVLAKSLFENAKRSKIDLDMLGIKYPATVELMPQVSSLALCSMNINDARTSLVHKCATTLQELHLEISIPRAMIYDVSDNFVVYPHLRRLQVHKCGYNDKVERVSTAPGFVPFPVLEILELCLPYPFADDVLFRGNSTKLRYLKMEVGRETALMLGQSREIDNNTWKLRTVSISDEAYRNLDTLEDYDRNISLCKLIGSTRRLKLQAVPYIEGLAALGLQGREFGRIRELYLGTAQVSVSSLMGLLKALPGLIKLTCDLGGLGEELSSIPSKELPDYVATSFSGAGKQLLTLSISFKEVTYTRAADSVMLIALVCPKLYKVRCSPGASPEYYGRIAKSLSRKPFRKYASQLGYLTDAHSLTF
ncbi:hypothetical protein IWW39_000647 [Coemansia spiralis]|uniref:Uncharacterized protein n=1 Tax=Coemansia spiralis TaxID=417178 RepID=A0A9W8L6Z7_9FUNG|nr:hypothetical protein IWW39_000647 [Coemansia spiralis]